MTIIQYSNIICLGTFWPQQKHIMKKLIQIENL